MTRWMFLSALIGALLLPPLLASHSAWAAAPDAGPSVLVRTGAAALREVAETVTAFGTVQPDPDRVLSLSLPHGGLVDRVWVRAGQRIGRGARLVELVSNPADHMQYLQAESALEFARHELKRRRQLLASHLATRTQVAAARRRLQDALATVRSLRSQGKGRASLVLHAPMDGIVTRMEVKAGQRVGAGSTALLIAAEHRLVAVLGVEPENVAGIRAGTPVALSSVFAPRFHLTARVREVHAMVNPATQLVDVLVPLPPRRLDDLVLGSHIEGRIRLNAHKALTVPRSAVLRDEKGAYVFTIAAGHARRIAVTTGLPAGNAVEVSGTLKAGDRVVTLGNYELHDGMAVREAAQ